MAAFARDLVKYLAALWQEWKTLLTGGSIIAVANLLGLITRTSLPSNVNWFIVGLTLVLAAFLAWRKQLREAEQWRLAAADAQAASAPVVVNAPNVTAE